MSPIRFCTADDGVRIAFTVDGSGAPIVRGGFYMNHLELDGKCAVWAPLLAELTRGHALVRHDMRGFGLSDRDARDVSLAAWVRDLEAVVDSARLERFALFAMCHGGAAAVEYAARHPERVTHLVLYGAYARGFLKRHPTPAELDEARLQSALIEQGWGRQNDAFLQVWPTLFQPDSTLEKLRSLADLQCRSAPAANALAMLRASAKIDVTDAAQRITCPTLVMHSRRSLITPFEEARLLAALIPGATLVGFDSRNHVLADDEPAWTEFVHTLRAFLPAGAAPGPPFAALTAREADVLEHLARGLDNAQIAAQLALSEKTVRNHITRIFDKLAVENRPQAIVRARERGYGRG